MNNRKSIHANHAAVINVDDLPDVFLDLRERAGEDQKNRECE